MTQTKTIIFYGAGVMLMAIPGFFTTHSRFAYLACMIGGLVLLAAAAGPQLTKPKTALLLLVITNLSFWLSVMFWIMRDRLIGLPHQTAIDPFVGPQLLWLLLFLIFVPYEVVVFLAGMIANRERKLAAIGATGVVAQVLITGRSIYLMLQGV
jgi:hypothetical protein